MNPQSVLTNDKFAGTPTAENTTIKYLSYSASIILCLLTLFAIPYESAYLLEAKRLLAFAAGIFGLMIVGAAFTVRPKVFSYVDRLAGSLCLQHRMWLPAWLVVGVALRLLWMLLFPVSPLHDELEYFQKATLMAQGLPQTTLFPNTSLFMPPGLPLFLTPFFYVFGAHVWVIRLCGLLLFAGTYYVTYALALRVQGAQAARLAPVFVAVCPSYLTLCGVNAKENLLILLLSAAVLLYVVAHDGAPNSEDGSGSQGFRWGFCCIAGIVMGFAALTQPGFILFPAVIAAFELVNGTGVIRTFWRVVVFAVFMVISIAPWTTRNYLVTNRFVPISTNGGQIFYFQNNSLANFHHSDSGPVQLPADEIEASKKGYQLGKEWIIQHPREYAALFSERQLYSLGDDTSGLFATLKAYGHPSRRIPASFYKGGKSVVNLLWFVICLLLLMGSPRFFQDGRWKRYFGVLVIPLIYQLGMDGTFEAETFHKIPYVVFMSIAIAIIVGGGTNRRAADELKS